MVLIVVIDALLKLAGTRKKLEYFELNFNEEMMVAGTNNFFNFFALGAPGYSQLKFNLLNAGISGTVKSRIPGLICAGINGVLYFSGFMAINYMPRFWLGALVIYAGLGFLDDNLIGVYVVVFESLVCLRILLCFFFIHSNFFLEINKITKGWWGFEAWRGRPPRPPFPLRSAPRQAIDTVWVADFLKPESVGKSVRFPPARPHAHIFIVDSSSQ